jgi:succinate dehydrogenase / fumarate reductase iron-sulfur subunit
MSCGCCLDACPQYTKVEDPEKWDESFVGANTIGQVQLFNMHDTGKRAAGERLDVLMGPGGVTDCGNAQNCVKVCPKEIPLTESIAAMGRAVAIHGIKKFFRGK